MLSNPLAAIAVLAYVAACLRLVMYRKQGARHRHHVSWLAWLLLVIFGGSAIDLTLHAKTVDLLEAGRAAVFALFIFGVRGNVARLLWSE